MIVFDLLCAAGHPFEGWFASADDFTSQKARSLLQCPSCGSAEVHRVPSASRFNLGAVEPKPAQPAKAPEKTPDMAGKYSRMLDELLTKTEDVGKDFPAEARRIYYKEAPDRAIRGQATEQEHDDLVDEGVPVARLPLPPGRLN
jgi:hypothetical protein